MPSASGGGSMPPPDSGPQAPASDDLAPVDPTAPVDPAGGGAGNSSAPVIPGLGDEDAPSEDGAGGSSAPTPTVQFFFPGGVYPTAAPTPLQSIGFDGSPPTIETFVNDTISNTTKVFTEDVPSVWQQTTAGFKYPTMWPTAAPTLDQAGTTAAPTQQVEILYPPSISVPLSNTWNNITNEDYGKDWNETIRGFKYPTEFPTERPTMYPTVEGFVKPADCWMFGMICDEVVSLMPTVEPTMAIEPVEATKAHLRVNSPAAAHPAAKVPAKAAVKAAAKAPVKASTKHKKRRRLSAFGVTLAETTVEPESDVPKPGTWRAMIHCTLFGVMCEEEQKEVTISPVPSEVIAAADKKAAAQVDGLESKPTQPMPAAAVSINSMAKLPSKNTAPAGGGAAIVQVVDAITDESAKGAQSAEPVAKKSVKKIGTAIAEATEEVTKMSHLPTRSKKDEKKKTKSVKKAKEYKKH